MIVTKPPTSSTYERLQVGCWGLLGVLAVCIVLLDAARLPVSSAPPASIASTTGTATVPGFRAAGVRKRNAVYQHHAAFIRNSSRAGIPILPPTSTPAQRSSLPPPNYSNFTITSNANMSRASRNESGVNVTAADRIGQALLDSSTYHIIGDNSICRSEECFETESIMHPYNIETIEHSGGLPMNRHHESAEYWRNSALNALNQKLAQKQVEAVAKNIIFFLGDGMSVPTVTAARILKGQQVDNIKFGEEGELHMDTFPYAGISKTFCSDAQVADSACTATAYFCGVKANSGTIGLTPDVLKNNCSGQNDPRYRLSSILAWAQAAGKSTGIVTTARVTHASPAGAYASIANRNWENDNEIRRNHISPDECDDIAEQLILRDPGRNINVILGGGRLQFLPRTKIDFENGRKGLRTDGKNLIEIWKQEKFNAKHAYVEGKQELLQVDTSEVDYLLGLFAPSHMEYVHEQEKRDDPSLTLMTEKAIQVLRKNPNGFFLFVEGARIDHAHHNNQGMRAIWETVEMDRALHQADEMTDDSDTLMLVTADHSHTFSIAGYPPRGNPISGIAEIALDNMPYTTLSYANGPAYKSFVNNRRYNISSDPVDDLKYKQIPNIPRKSETHGGDDVSVLTKGPFAHLFTGVQQQSYIPHALGYIACIGPGPKFCDRNIHAFY